jgi:ABC-type uncharacterized transport system permease subunit
MVINTISFLTFFTYSSAALCQILKITRKLAFPRLFFLTLVLFATLLHSYLLYQWIDTPHGQNLSLSHLFSLICWGCLVLSLVVSFKKMDENLVLLTLVISALSILLVLFFPGNDLLATHYTPSVLAHILISILAFGILMMATLQAILWYCQNRYLKTRSFQTLDSLLPPLQTLENHLFKILLIGFVCLSLSLLGVFLCFDLGLIEHHLGKTTLSLTAWGLFAALLYQRYQTGFRGLKPIYWTFLSLGFLLMAYLTHKALSIT